MQPALNYDTAADDDDNDNEMMVVYSEEDVLIQYRTLTGVSRGSAVIKSVFCIKRLLSLS